MGAITSVQLELWQDVRFTFVITQVIETRSCWRIVWKEVGATSTTTACPVRSRQRLERSIILSNEVLILIELTHIHFEGKEQTHSTLLVIQTGK